MPWYWVLILGLALVVITSVVVNVVNLFNRPDSGIDDSEEYSGVFNVREYNKAQHDSGLDNRVRSKYDGESG